MNESTSYDPLQSHIPEDVTQVALKTFFNIAEKWQATEAQQMKMLGLGDKSELTSWKQDGLKEIPKENLERISHVLAIYRSLRNLFPTSSRADAWIRKSNDKFNGLSALDFICQEPKDGLVDVRKFLQTQKH